MKKRYRSTMIIGIDVWADDEEDAVQKCADHYFDFVHEWSPSLTEELDEDDDWFHPMNEEED